MFISRLMSLWPKLEVIQKTLNTDIDTLFSRFCRIPQKIQPHMFCRPIFICHICLTWPIFRLVGNRRMEYKLFIEWRGHGQWKGMAAVVLGTFPLLFFYVSCIWLYVLNSIYNTYMYKSQLCWYTHQLVPVQVLWTMYTYKYVSCMIVKPGRKLNLDFNVDTSGLRSILSAVCL